MRATLAIFVLIIVTAVLFTAEPAPRPAWTTSKVVGSPEPPPPFRCVVAFENLKFDRPVVMARVPGSRRLVIGEQGGKLFHFENKPYAKAVLFADLKKDIRTVHQDAGAKGVHEFYGIAFHPQFENNRECYICYVLRGKKGERSGPYDHDKNLPDGSRVSRFKVKDDFTLDSASEEILFTFLQGGHNGGDMQFGPDGMLYISTGDAADPNPPDHFKTGQDITDLLASILRIDVDKREAGKSYAIPKDNPFVGIQQFGKPVRKEIWAFGFRNPWRMSFDRVTGDLFTGDVGWEAWEMVHQVKRGGNHGWSLVEARQGVNMTWPAGPGVVIPPVIELDHALAASVTGGYVYRGKKYSALQGKYIFGDWSSRRIWAATLANGELQKLDEITTPTVRVVAFGEDHDGELYLLDYDSGRIFELQTNDAAKFDPAAFPRTLAQTGLFKEVKSHTIADGIVPYEINAHQWQDGATAQHWIALPNRGAVIDNDERRTIPGDVDWHQYKLHFPKNTVLVKTLSLPNAVRVETQLLHFDGVDWQGYSYRWRADQNDADLVPAEGAEARYFIEDPRIDGGKRELNWTFHNRAQCLQCHNFWAEYALGFQPMQLNRNVAIAGTTKNQLVHFAEIGVMTRADKAGKPRLPHNAVSVKTIKAMVDPTVPTPDITGRSRSYLHANCAHCHRFGGGGAVEFELNFDRDLQQAKIFDIPRRGDFGIPDARVIARGDPKRSTLYYRMAKFGGGRMPHLGSEWPDEFGLSLIHDWISDMKGDAHPMPQGDHAEQLKTLRGAMELAKQASCECCTQEERASIFAEAKKLPAGNVRDLFEGFITPPGQERKLGQTPRPKTILNLQGDAKRGEALYKLEKLQCVTCHRIAGQGGAIGPELDKALVKRSRADILDSLLEPNRRIEQNFQTYVLKTESGASHTGLLIRKTDAEVVLRLADGKEVSVKAADVAGLEVSRQSLMPAGLLADLTPQQAADLLAFLESSSRNR